MIGKAARPARKTLVVHIGHFKTGTTALQVFLSQNPRQLARRGLDYAGYRQAHAKHSDLAFCLFRAAGVDTLMHGYDCPDSPAAIWQGLFDHVRASRRQTVIVSSEEFMRLGAHPAAAGILAGLVDGAGDIDIRIIAYLRRPQSHLRSWYNQLVKMGAPVPGFNEAVQTLIEPVHFDYGLALQPWAELFGPAAVTVRAYDEASRGTNRIFADFLGLLGASPPGPAWILPESDPNPAIDARILELTRLIQGAGMPADVEKWTRSRAEAYFRDRDARRARVPIGFAALAAQAAAGLGYVAGLPGGAGAVAGFADHLPQPQDDEIEELRDLNGFLLSELHFLRRRMNESDRRLGERIAALERRLPSADPEDPG